MADGVFTSEHKYARVSARKARLVMDLIRGESVDSALNKLAFCQRRAAPMIHKVVRSAIANATQAVGAESEELVIWRAYVDEGPTMKRWRPRAQGRAYPRLRRTCHLRVALRRVGDDGSSAAGSGTEKANSGTKTAEKADAGHSA